jgi:hypothetical protein
LTEESSAEPISCSTCGCTSTWRAAFTPVRDGTITRICCPNCAEQFHSRWSRWSFWGYAIAAMFLLLNFSKGRVGGMDLVIAASLLFFVAQLPLIVLHEIGHAIVAALVGATPYAIALGREPWIVDRRFLGLRWRIGRQLTQGLCYHAPCEGVHSRRNTILILAGGALMNAAIAGLAIAAAFAFPPRFDHSLLRFAFLVVGFSSAFLCVWSVWPREVDTAVGKIPNDGAQILQLLRGRVDELAKGRGAHHYLLATFAFADGDYPRAEAEALRALAEYPDPKLAAAVAILRSAAHCETGEARRAIDQLRGLEAAVADDPGLRSGVLNNLAWAHLLTDEPPLIEQGIALSASAREVAPWFAPYSITRACLIAASATDGNGRIAEAEAILRRVSAKSLESRSLGYLFLACGLVAAAKGDRETARGALERARRRGAASDSLRLLERRLASP